MRLAFGIVLVLAAGGCSPLRGVEEAITSKNAALFAERFNVLTATCNARHQLERVPFIHGGAITIRPRELGEAFA
jgi:hypothetical protein